MDEKIRVLLIDDDKTHRNALSRYLRSVAESVAEFDVSDFANGVEALEHLKTSNKEYSVVLLDFMLEPAMTGEDVIKKIKGKYPQLPIIVFTGRNRTGAAQTLAAGAEYFMSRPINRTELVNTIQNLAEQNMFFKELAKDTRKLLDADICLAWRLNRQEHRFEIAAWDEIEGKELDADYRHKTFLALDHPATKKLLENQNLIHLEDVTDPESAPDYLHRKKAKEFGWTSLISIPLVQQKQVIGLLDGYYYLPKIFQEYGKERWLNDILPAFSKQAAEAIRNAQLTEQAQAVQNINQLLAGTYDKRTIIDTILVKGLELVSADAGWVYLVDSNAKKLVLSSIRGIAEDAVEKERDFEEGITGQAAENGQVIYVPNLLLEQSSGHTETLEHIRSEVAVPLRREERTIGVMTVKSRAVDAFIDDDIELLTVLAAQAAVAVERTKLNTHLQKISQLALGQNFKELADYVVYAARDLTGAEVILWMEQRQRKEQEKTFRIYANQGDFDTDYIETASFPIGPKESITGAALKNKKPIYRADIQNNSEKPPFHNMKNAKKRGWHSFMVVPLLGEEDQSLGSLSLYDKEIDKFGKPEAELMVSFTNQVAIAFEDVQQQNKLKRLADGNQTLNNISAELMGLLNEDKILDLVARSVSRAIDCAHCSIFRLEADKLVVRKVYGQYAQSIKLQRGRTFEIGQGVAGWVAENGKSALVPNTLDTDEDRFDPGWSGDENPLSLLVVPIILEKGRDVYGVISVEHNQIAAFDDHDLQLLETLAYQISSAIKNALLVKKLKALNKMGQELSKRLDVEQIYTTLVQAIAETLDCTHSTYFVVEEKEVVPKASFAPEGKFNVTRQFKLGEGLAGLVAQTGEEIFTPEAQEHEHFADGQKRSAFGRSMIVVPVKVDNQVVGVISVEQDRSRAFDANDLQMVNTVALQAAVAIENAQLFGQQIDAVEEISSSIAEPRDLELVLYGILEWTQILMGASNLCEVRLYNPETNTLKVVAASGQGIGEEHEEVSIEKGITGRVARNALEHKNPREMAPEYVPDVSKEKDDYIDFLGNTQSEIAVPMLDKKDALIGVLNIEHPDVEAYDENEIKLAKALANLATVAIENARLFEQLDRKLKEQKAVNYLGQTLTASIDLEEEQIVKLIYEQASKLMHTENMYVALYEKSTDEVSFPLMFIDGKRHEEPSRKAGIGKGRTEHIIRTKEPLLIHTEEKSKAWYGEPGRKEYIGEPFASWLGVPIAIGDQVLGVIATYHKTENYVYDEDDQAVLEAIASQAAIALQNIRYVDELEAFQDLAQDFSTGSFLDA